ncbi:MAG: DUF3300 domain-containing protein [Bryobacterales bacterium]|nr:DUF3300 domain-containing protein [Bryobacterales bacterium]
MLTFTTAAFSQIPLDAGEIDRLVAPIALYPDALMAQVLSASTYPEQIEEAAAWSDGHSYLTGDDLADAIIDDHLPWDASVLSLLPFPSVLDLMASDMDWTRRLGAAVLNQRSDVLNEIQKLRQKASSLGYLVDSSRWRIVRADAGFIEILSVDPEFYFVPEYDPAIVFVRPRASVDVGISFGERIPIAEVFEQWGWRRSGFNWPSRSVVLDGSPWQRTQSNAKTYRHPYRTQPPQARPRVERHELRPVRHPSRPAVHR